MLVDNTYTRTARLPRSTLSAGLLRAWAALDQPWVYFWLLTWSGIILYLPLLSINYDLNGIIEVEAVEAGGVALINPHHLLSRPLGFALYQGAIALGYRGGAIPVLQALSAISAGLGVGLSYLFFERLTRRRVFAVGGALILATSWAYWKNATDATYMTLALTAVAAALAVGARGRASTDSAVYVGTLSGLSVLLWQANVFALPALLIEAFNIDGGLPTRSRARHALTMLGVCAATVMVPYVLAASLMAPTLQQGPTLRSWLTEYGAHLPMWGDWHIERVAVALVAAVASFVPLSDGLALRQLGSGNVDTERLLPQLSVIAICLSVVVLVTMWIAASIQRRRWRIQHSWLLLGYLAYLPFFVWFDPADITWHVAPNLFLIAFGVSTLRRDTSTWKITLLAASGITIAAAVASVSILPRHMSLGANRTLAECVSDRTNPDDLLIAADWDWSAYVRYLDKRPVFDLIDARARGNSVSEISASILEHVNTYERSGGRVITLDSRSYTPENVDWLNAQVGLSPEFFARLESSPLFECEGRIFARVTGIEAAGSPVNDTAAIAFSLSRSSLLVP